MNLIKMSFFGAVVILVIAVIRALAINRLPKKTFLVLWGIALVRLLVPYSMPSALSVYSLAGRLARPLETGVAGTGMATVPPEMAFSVPGTNAASQAEATGTAFPAADPLVLVWAIGMLACTAFFVMTWLRCRREFRESLPVQNGFVKSWLDSHQLRRHLRIRQSDKISAPLTYGIFQPVILLSKRTDWDDEKTLAYVLAHEYIHIRRFDAVAKLALTTALCIHWFNPVVWAMYVLANRDLELSCDEAVIRRFGERTKSAYAMTLLRMEETRSGLGPLCNNFSKHAIEERMVAIMKTKKRSWVAVLVALTLVVGVTTTFATTGQSAAAQDADAGDGANAVQTAMDDCTVISYTDPTDGKTYGSWDGGTTWTPMTDEELNTASGLSDVEWWTAEEYAEWLEQEKIDLQACIGGKAWNPTDSWYPWTQERVDEAIARYEQTLKDIQGGMKISKPTGDGDAMIQFGYDTDLQTTATDTKVSIGFAEALGSSTDYDTAVEHQQEPTPELLAEYQPHGLTYDKTKKAFFFHGKLVRYFFDSYTLENGVATIYDYVNEAGDIDVSTVRKAVQNTDGSTNPGGRLVRIEEAGKDEFDNRFMMTPQTAQETAVFGFAGTANGGNVSESGDTGPVFMADLERYAPFGVTFVKSGNFGNVYWNGKLVDVLVDHAPDGKYQTISSSDTGGIKIQTVYDGSGRLTGVEPVKD